jgi:hypothetical protein
MKQDLFQQRTVMLIFKKQLIWQKVSLLNSNLIEKRALNEKDLIGWVLGWI